MQDMKLADQIASHENAGNDSSAFNCRFFPCSWHFSAVKITLRIRAVKQFVTLNFNLFVFHLELDVVGPLLLNASLLPVLTTDYSADH